MKTLTLLTVLSLGAAAQTIGLPTVGLTGDPNNPIIVNNSDKPILATVVVREGTGDRPHVNQALFLPPGSGALPPGGQVPVFRALPTVRVNGGTLDGWTLVATKATLVLVVFTDGTIIGEDAKSADAIAEQLKAIVKEGQMAIAGQWIEFGMRPGLNDTMPLPHVDHDLTVAGTQLSRVRAGRGEAAALDLARIYAALPTVLHR